ncbi:cell division protein FtsQ/DivIB [Leucobacter chromiireducens]|uniref:cell division protein FtsQ/DivIB n=1 Tax=Leucobacter chromiireducens TaxID=283877 RepID=UPI000F62C422|nr:FtsQ-type POTRA domain-containing protein [Leucobacter chromiireducens]
MLDRLRSGVAPRTARESGDPAPADPAPAEALTVDLSAELDHSAELDVPPRAGSALTRWRAARAEDPVRAAERRVRAAERQRKSQLRREQQRFTVAARRRRRVWLIVLGAVVGLILFVAAGVFTPLMGVRSIEIVGASNVPEDEVREALAEFTGVPLALVDDGDVHRALEPFPLIQRYAVERIPPHTLTVRIEERVAVVSLAEDGGVGLYDAAGVKLGTAEAAPAGVPLGGGAIKDRASQAFGSATRALRDMPESLRTRITEVSASSGQDVTFTLDNGIEVMWGDSESSRRKSAVLATMLKSLEGREVSYIDVSSSEAPVFR